MARITDEVAKVAPAIVNATIDEARRKQFGAEMKHWSEPLEGVTLAYGTDEKCVPFTSPPTITLAELADRAETLEALGMTLRVSVRRRDTSRSMFRPDYGPDRLVFFAEPKR